MKWETLKTLFAAIGALFLVITALSVVIAIFTGGSFSSRDKVAVIELEGIITDPAEAIQQFQELEDRDDVKAVVLRIDSPGGAVGPSQEIHSEIIKFRKKKKVVASLGTIAASGGYYAAAATDKIVANPGTITGSIGVIVEFFNAEELLSKLGLKGYVVKSGKYKDVGSPLRKMEAEERALLQSVIDDVNGQFIKAVADGRNMKVEDVAKIADGRIFSGAQARERGLVDELGGLRDAIDISAELAGITGKPEVVYLESKKMSLWNTVFGESAARSFTELFSGMRIMYMTPNPER
ncbi:MAG: signal peptide peptidase SppA [Deltaproteobacteria bacterium]|nr:signal peptide peptidase SppA [Deltaproteobacteria bacterium]